MRLGFSFKWLIISLAALVLVLVVLFPGWYPIRAFEGVFSGVCNGVLRGEFHSVQETNFVGLGGAPIRKDYAECGVTPAVDANRICYVAPNQRPSFIGTNPLGAATSDECDLCQFGSEDIKDGKYVLGKSCRPYKFIWRWKYKGNF